MAHIPRFGSRKVAAHRNRMQSIDDQDDESDDEDESEVAGLDPKYLL